MTEQSGHRNPLEVSDALSAYWDTRVGDDTANDASVSGGLVEMVDWLHASDTTPPLLPGQRAQIWQELIATHVTDLEPHLHVPDGPHRVNGKAPRLPLRQSAALPRWSRGNARPGWVLTQFATAALVLLTLVAGFFVFGPARLGQRGAPVLIPASSETPALPKTEATAVAEVLWQASGGPDLPFIEPGQPAIDPQGNLWVPDSGYSQFLIFAPDGTFLEAWGTPGSDEGQFRFDDPRHAGIGYGGVAFDATGNIYVADTGNRRIQKFGSDRTFITSWGSEGSGDGQFRRPIALAVDEEGRVYVSDEGWGTIQVFADDGTWLETWSDLGAPVGIAIDGPRGTDLDRNGAIALWAAEGGGVVKLSASGERLVTWDTYGTEEGAFLNPLSIAVDAEGRVFVADQGADRVQVFSPDGAFLAAWGERGPDAGQFRAPRGLVLDGEGFVYVTENDGKRVQKFRLLPPLFAGHLST